MKVLPLTYLGNTAYFSHLAGGGCVIDLGENYVKQSYRNRCDIMTAGGVDVLTVNVAHGGSRIKRPVRDMRIDYSKRWQHRHRMALMSAYRNSPYFDHYWDRFAPFYEKRFEFLADLNTGLLRVMTEIVAPGTELHFSESYIEPSDEYTDLRGAFEPVRRDPEGGIVPNDARPGTSKYCTPGCANDGYSKAPPLFEPYWQVFSDRHPFAPNLSVIDLIFCEGRDFKLTIDN